ncbi:hypothetical protein [Candidatus Bealeia paramacronuclearis]|uniref:hypothetical protein n=1 Tax=Candidatus Bealeia paramacronuclearis TaxID=1921001 RepID=UPI002F262025
MPLLWRVFSANLVEGRQGGHELSDINVGPSGTVIPDLPGRKSSGVVFTEILHQGPGSSKAALSIQAKRRYILLLQDEASYTVRSSRYRLCHVS